MYLIQVVSNNFQDVSHKVNKIFNKIKIECV